VQVELLATRLPQVLVTVAKSPVTEKPEIASEAVPELLRVTVWGALVVPRLMEPNEREVAERVDMEVPPVPLSVIGSATTLLLMTAEPVREPVAVGANTMPTVQVDPGARVETHVLLVWVKSPVIVSPVNVTADPPTFVTETVCMVLFAPTPTMPKVSDEVETVSCPGGMTGATGIRTLDAQPVRTRAPGRRSIRAERSARRAEMKERRLNKGK
jgi:hypothetical protein